MSLYIFDSRERIALPTFEVTRPTTNFNRMFPGDSRKYVILIKDLLTKASGVVKTPISKVDSLSPRNVLMKTINTTIMKSRGIFQSIRQMHSACLKFLCILIR
jgi:hypothetical protein